MNKVKSRTKKCTQPSDTHCAKKEHSENFGLDEKIDKLTITVKSVNGLVNGVDGKHKSESKAHKKERTHSKEVSTDKKIESKVKHKSNSVHSIPVEATDLKLEVSNEKGDYISDDPSPSTADSVASTSNVYSSKCDPINKTNNTSDLKVSKGKSKAKKQDLKVSSGEGSSSKSECKLKPEDIDSPDFDITSIIRLKYADSKNDDVTRNERDCDEAAGTSRAKTECAENVEVSQESEEELKIETPVIDYVQYESELQMPMIMKIIQKDLSEPYSIYTYRYFIHNWPNLCFLAMSEENCVGAIVCKLDLHRKVIKRGYIAMLAVDKNYRKHGIGSTLVRRAIQEMIEGDADEVVLETEITNKPALRLYEALGFVRDKRLFRYYLNGVDALRLKLWLR